MKRSHLPARIGSVASGFLANAPRIISWRGGVAMRDGRKADMGVSGAFLEASR